MSYKTRWNAQKKEIEMSGALVMTREQWEQRGGTYQGGVLEASQKGYLTVKACKKLGQPVSAEEMESCQNYAMFKGCYMEFCIGDKGRTRPYLPVFFRNTQEQEENKDGGASA